MAPRSKVRCTSHTHYVQLQQPNIGEEENKSPKRITVTIQTQIIKKNHSETWPYRSQFSPSLSFVGGGGHSPGLSSWSRSAAPTLTICTRSQRKAFLIFALSVLRASNFQNLRHTHTKKPKKKTEVILCSFYHLSSFFFLNGFSSFAPTSLYKCVYFVFGLCIVRFCCCAVHTYTIYTTTRTHTIHDTKS